MIGQQMLPQTSQGKANRNEQTWNSTDNKCQKNTSRRLREQTPRYRELSLKIPDRVTESTSIVDRMACKSFRNIGKIPLDCK